MPEIIVKLGDNVIQKFFFFQEELGIGRAPDNQIVIENLAISRNHARVKFDGKRYSINDLDSSNGTFVNGVRVKSCDLTDKDVITVGKHKLYFYDQKASEVVRQPSFADSDSTMLVDSMPVEIEAELVVNKGRQKGQRHAVGRGETRLGRGPDNEIRLTDWFVSKAHAVIERRDDKFMIRDLESWRHTYVNGTAVTETPLHDKDVIQLGPTVELLFEVKTSRGGNQPAAAEPEQPAYQEAPVYDFQEQAEAEAQPEYAPEPAYAEQDYAQEPEPVWPESSEGTSQMPLDALHALDADSAPDYTGQMPIEEAWPAQESAAGGVPEHTGVMPMEEEAPAYEEAAAPDMPDHPLLAVPAEAHDDHVGAVYEDLAEASLLAAADSATAPASASNGSARKPKPEPAAPPADDGEVAMWERALANKSQVIRRQAARRLKQLTGKDYDY